MSDKPIDMVLHCPSCGLQHIDEPEQERVEQLHEGDQVVGSVIVGWDNPPHRSHLCHGCSYVWRPADVPTNGVLAVTTHGQADSAKTLGWSEQTMRAIEALKRAESHLQAAQALVPVHGHAWHAIESADDRIHDALARLGD